VEMNRLRRVELGIGLTGDGEFVRISGGS